MIIIYIFTFLKIMAFATVVSLALGRTPGPRLIRWIAAGGAVCLSLNLYLFITFQALLRHDFQIFWRVGRDLWSGLDPYDPARFAASPFLNPPTALPLFALFAAPPYLISLTLWTLLNVLFVLALPSVAQRALSAQEGSCTSRGKKERPISWRLPRLVLVGLTTGLIVSDAVTAGLFTSQLGLLTALALLAALEAQGRGRRILAGFWLALATIKVSTMLPFLLFFHRKADLRTWAALAFFCGILCLMTGSPSLLFKRLDWTVQQIETLSSPGQVNDYSFQGTQSVGMLGFDHAFYRLGLRNRAVIRGLQLVAVLLLGLWVACQVFAKQLPRPATCSLVALYSVLFFYHRIYDTVILTLPLVYCVGRARFAVGRSRWCFVLSAVSILLVMYLSSTNMKSLTGSSFNWGPWGRLVQAIVLPYATWSVILAMACLYHGDKQKVSPCFVQGGLGAGA